MSSSRIHTRLGPGFGPRTLSTVYSDQGGKRLLVQTGMMGKVCRWGRGRRGGGGGGG